MGVPEVTVRRMASSPTHHFGIISDQGSQAGIYAPAACWSGGAAHPAMDDYVSFELSAFSMYRPPKPSNRAVWDERNYEYKMESLHQLNNKQGVSELLFDGILSVGQERRYVQGVPFKTLSIDGYGDHSAHTATGIWIQSSQGRQSAIWYQLRHPAEEYTRYHKPFLWMANLSKYFVDYLAEHDAVRLRDFRRRFYEQLVARHGSNEHFVKWLGESRSPDFRTSVAANAGFLFNESWNINTELTSHPIWSEIGPVELSAVPQQPQEEAKTIVTPYTYVCFKNMYFSKWLEARHPTNEVLNLQRRRQEALGFRPHGTSSHAPLNRALPSISREFRVGDVVGVNRDEESIWKDGQDIWFAYVQRTRKDTEGRQLLDVIWLYRPIDTTLSTMTYPVKNELFFSDHCNCDEHVFRAADVVCKVNVDWRPFSKGLHAQQDLQHDFIVRQVYRVEDNSFSTLRTTDFKCDCRTPVTQSELELLMTKFEVGDSVLFSSKGHGPLEPAVIDFFLHGKGSVLMRRLPRRARDLGHKEARPNEVVWTSSFFTISAKQIIRKCAVRFYTTEDLKTGCIPAPTTGMEQRTPSISPANSFDRGLEEGGAVEFIGAVDLAAHAMHTYQANLKEPDRMRLFFGSVNDYLAQAIAGKWSVLRVGEVDFLSAGNPCVAFSTLQPNKQSEESLKNASLVASVVAYIDLYRPQYAVLENVVAMTHKIGGTDQNVFSQLLCALVGMGYQVKQFCLDAWSVGSAQSRSRLFISIAAPGLEPLAHPALTHAHPSGIKNASLGKAVNGQRFGQRWFDQTPFEHVTAREATQDLPWIGDSAVQSCIEFPDHRTSRVERALRRTQISMIPVFPPGQNFVKAIEQGYMGLPQRLASAREKNRHRSAKISHAWGRIPADGLMPTITTICSPADAFHGNVLHWDQPRCLTVMEARRAQGFPDEEVIIGLPANQWKIIGNSVARPVALALGMALRDSWLANPPEPEPPATGITQPAAVNADTGAKVAGLATAWSYNQSYQDPDRLLLSATGAAGASVPSVREDLNINGSLRIRRSSVVHRTRTTERIVDTTEMALKTTISKSTRTALENKAHEPAEPAIHPSAHGSPPSVVKKSARSAGLEPELTPTKWHTIPGRSPSSKRGGRHTKDSDL
ncbi:hypothetical protein H2199_000853 [Coniosporium tulheliwenetii]|uniref:Uncharacterized protein n=1 Tax=Coniosporium tulheliwenetii TaxID=3383036 RepID=A0ACC2ZMZ4_9PEZI|nr:hypothetical protein H2199_000853 [Cladosporium sp. JES 115]